MYYAYIADGETIVTAGDSADEFAAFEKFAEVSGLTAEAVERFELMTLRPGLKAAFRVMETNRDVLAHSGIEVMEPSKAVVRAEMMEGTSFDRPKPGDTRTYREIFNLPEIKKKKKTSGVEGPDDGTKKPKEGMSGESFAPTTDEDVQIRSAKIDEHGNIDVLAQKGLFSEKETEETENPDRIQSKAFGTFFRLDVYDMSPEEADKAFADAEIDVEKYFVASGTFDNEDGKGVWFAGGVKRLTEKAAEALAELGVAMEIYAVNRENQRLVEKGSEATVIDSRDVVEGPRPWNSGRDEWEAMSEEERDKVLQGSEFAFATQTVTGGTRVAIVPVEHFMKDHSLFAEDLPIKMPDVFKPLAPGIYHTYLKPSHVQATLGKAGMAQSLLLLAHLPENFLTLRTK